MAEYIEREALINKMRVMPIPEQAGRFNTWLDNCALGVNAAIKTVANFPAADVTPVRHRRWEKYFHSYFGRHQCVCSECKNDDYWKKNFCYGYENYCPNCGAKMDLKEGEQE